jgi:alkylation response protein AidB-like acyl-CoA dehydrogenase
MSTGISRATLHDWREHPVSANHSMPGPYYGHTVSEKYLNARELSIYGGSNEIQRNIIAKAVLGL